MNTLTDQDDIGDLRVETVGDALSDRYLAYALSIITARSLPDARDGLKPVQRRILFGMQALRLGHASGYKKCARIVGDVMGKFHPHGDKAIYDALARLAQDFSVRYPLVDGQGNFGNLDGDNPAAMRYTEARLTDLAELLLEGLGEEAVAFRTTYDGEQEEPEVLPAGFPQLLCNGASGIAVGMATNIPPHNLEEICQAAIYLIRHPQASLQKLMEFVPGPDFPTGGVICESSETLMNIYGTGRGSITVRANWHVEKLKGGQWQAIVTGLPYPLKKSRLLEKMAQLQDDKKLPFLADARDESDAEIRLVLIPKSRTMQPEVFMEGLFQKTDLQLRFGVNMNVLTDQGRRPKLMGLRELIQEWLDHRLVVLLHRTKYRLDQIAERLNILEGLRICYAHLDAIIRLIRESDKPKADLMAEYGLNELQAEAILQMRLRSLSKLREEAIEEEYIALIAEQSELRALYEQPDLQWKTITAEIQEVKKRYSAKHPLGGRRTEVAGTVISSDVDIEAALMPSEPVTVIISKQGWVRVLKGHDHDPSKLNYRQDDEGRFFIEAQSQQSLLFFADNGRFYSLGVDKLPGGKGYGEPLHLLLKLDSALELIQALPYAAEQKLLLASSSGRGLIVPAKEVIAQTKNGKRILHLNDKEVACHCSIVAGDWIACLNKQHKLLIFALDQIPELNKGRGVILMQCKGTKFLDAQTFLEEDGPIWLSKEGRRRQLPDWQEWSGQRARAGKTLPKGMPKGNGFQGK